MTANTRYLHCIYADDVRQEVNNKLIIVGMYMGGMHVSQMPTVLPQLCVIADLHVPKDQLMTSLKLTLSFGGKDIIAVDAPESQLPKIEDFKDPESQAMMVQMVVQVAPFKIDGPSKLRVTALINGEQKVHGNSLNVLAQVKPAQ